MTSLGSSQAPLGKVTVRPLTEGDLPQLRQLREIGFLDTSDPDDARLNALHHRLLPYRRGLFVGETLSSSATVLPFTMRLGGRTVKMGGLASVQSAAEFRRRGHVRTLLHHLLDELRARGVGFCLEYPFDPRFYARMGWQSLPNGVIVKLPLERLPPARKTDARRLDATLAAARLEPLQQEWAMAYNGPLARGADAPRPFGEVVQRPWETRARPVYEVDGGYGVLALEQADDVELNVVDYAFTSPEGRKNLLALLSLFAGQASTVRMHLPSDDPLAADAAPFVVAGRALQARVVDVVSALTALAPAQEARFSLRVRDDVCAWNNRTVALELDLGGVALKPWAQSPEVDVDVRGLAALLMGGLSAEAALRAGLASGSLTGLRALAGLAGGRGVFMPQADYF